MSGTILSANECQSPMPESKMSEPNVTRVLRINLLAALTRWDVETDLGAFRTCSHTLSQEMSVS